MGQISYFISYFIQLKQKNPEISSLYDDANESFFLDIKPPIDGVVKDHPVHTTATPLQSMTATPTVKLNIWFIHVSYFLLIILYVIYII